MTVFSKGYLTITILIIISLLFSYKILVFANNFVYDYHFTLLAQSFLKGTLDIQPGIQYFPLGDMAFFNNKYYLYFGPLPSLLLLPAVILFGPSFPQNSLTILAGFLSFFIVVKISQKLKLRSNNSLWIAAFYAFGTIYSFLTLVNITAFQVQAIGNFFMLLSLHEFVNKKRYFLIGLFLALAMAVRLNLAGGSVFFIATILSEKASWGKKLDSIVLLAFPILVFAVCLLFYNFARFQKFFETGYQFNITLPHTANYQAAKEFGVFSLNHIPINLYYFLFKGPDLLREAISGLPKFPFLKADEWGLSIVFTSPLLLLAFIQDQIKKYLSEIIAIIFISIPIFTYYGVGFSQFGYRYAFDFYPFLLLILLKFLNGNLLITHKALIVYSIFFNLFFMFSIWGKYPLLIIK